MTATDLVTRPAAALSVAAGALTIQEIVSQKQLIAQAMSELMKDGEHYGTIPGAKKPSLWKPGADLICSMFQLEADYIAEEVVHQPDYIYYRYKCILKHIPTDRRVGAGLGSCNSREEKYRRQAPKKCPGCDKETIFRSKPRNKKEEENPDSLGWYCWAKKGGCGRQFVADDPSVAQQDNGIADPSDLDNTILKMSLKRARIDAVLTVTAAGDFFSQDLEDLSERAKRLLVIDVNPDPPVKEGSAPKASNGAASTAAPPTSASAAANSPPTGTTTSQSAQMTSTGQTTATSKRPRAPSIKHDGTVATHKQVAYLHMLKSKLEIPDCDGTCAKLVEEETKWGKKVKRFQRCVYHAQLAAFKDKDNYPITTSTKLSEGQISNLIDRYEAKLERQENRADNAVADLDAAFESAEQNARIRGELGPGADG